MANIISRVNRA